MHFCSTYRGRPICHLVTYPSPQTNATENEVRQTATMASSSHQIAIARASLAASLLRADPVPISRDEISNFHVLLDTTLAICSPPNIQVETTTDGKCH